MVFLHELWEKAKALWGEFSRVGAETYASSITYFGFLSFVPLLALCISLVSLVGFGEEEVVAFLTAMVPDAFDDIVKALVGDAFRRSGLAFSLSILVLLWSASKVVKALRRGLNAAYGMQETRNAVAVAGLSILATIILGVLFAAIVYLVFSNPVIHALEAAIPGLELAGLADVVNPVVTVVLSVLVLDVCYAYLPAGTRRLSTRLPGAVFGAVAWGALALGFRIYVEHFSNVTVLYGSIATIALLLMWMYFVSYIFIAGGFMNRAWADRQQRLAK